MCREVSPLARRWGSCWLVVILVEIDLDRFRCATNRLRRSSRFHRGIWCRLHVESDWLTRTRDLVDLVYAQFERAVFVATLGYCVDNQEAQLPVLNLFFGEAICVVDVSVDDATVLLN